VIRKTKLTTDIPVSTKEALHELCPRGTLVKIIPPMLVLVVEKIREIGVWKLVHLLEKKTIALVEHNES